MTKPTTATAAPTYTWGDSYDLSPADGGGTAIEVELISSPQSLAPALQALRESIDLRDALVMIGAPTNDEAPEDEPVYRCNLAVRQSRVGLLSARLETLGFLELEEL